MFGVERRRQNGRARRHFPQESPQKPRAMPAKLACRKIATGSRNGPTSDEQAGRFALTEMYFLTLARACLILFFSSLKFASQVAIGRTFGGMFAFQ